MVSTEHLLTEVGAERDSVDWCRGFWYESGEEQRKCVLRKGYHFCVSMYSLKEGSC